MAATESALRSKADQRFITGTGHFTATTSTGPARSMPTSSASPACTPGSATRAGPRRRPACSRCSTGDDVKAAMGQPDLRLDGQVQGRLGHEGRAPPDARPGQGPTSAITSPAWSLRPTIRRAMRREAGSRSTTTSCRRARRPRTPAIRARRRSTTRSPATRSTSGSSATAAVDQAIAAPPTSPGRSGQQSPGAERDRAAAALAEYDRATDGLPLPPARTRTWRGW